jgi:vancomycin resistance protein YoaR
LFNPLHIAVATLIVVVLALGAFYVVNLVSNWGKIHQGVYVGTVDVGGLTTDQAAQLIDQVFQADAESKPVDLYQSDALREAGSTAGIDVLDDSVTDYKSSSVNTANTSWQLDADYLGVGVDGQALASQAAAFGHGGDFWLGTWRLAFGQQRVTPALTYDQTKLSLVDDVLTRSIGNWPVNWDLKYNSTQASYALKPGSDGHIVNMPLLQSSLDAAFLGADAQARRLTVPMMVQAPDVTQAIAQGCAATIQGLIAQPISLTYKAKQWSFSTKTLGNWLSIDPVQAADGSWSLKAEMSAATLKSNMKYMVGDSITVLKDPVDATFKVVGDTPYVVPARSGKGINYQELANQINAILYSPGGAGVGSGRSIALPLGTLAPDITTKEAEGMDIDERISTYTTTYNSTSERINNVHRGADLINGALVAPGGTFSFNKRTGECTAAKGFEAAPVIENGQDVDAIAGGLCQVATTLFNAVFESGLPVAERANHSLYIASYPTGRDAAVSYPQLDFKFTNDTDHYLLVQMSYTDTSLTCTLWGQDPGYQVTSQTGDWQTVSKFKTVKKKDPTLPVGTTEVKTAGQDARKITVRRIVKDKDGNVIRDTVFTSRYKAVNQVLLVGTKKG